MKACIVTVYNSENCGSYWQAFALKHYLELNGYEVSFLRRNMKGASHSSKAVIKKVLYALLRRQPRRAFGVIRQHRIFDKAISAFDVVEECTDDFDVCLLGSDTIWNLEWNYFAKERETYWGNKSKAVKTVSYAASLANTGADTISEYPEVIEYLNGLHAVGVRDAHTVDVLKEFTSKEMTIVCDPTILFDKNYYKSFCKEKEDDSLFVYYFNKMPKDIEDNIRLFAKKNHLKIVVMGNSMKGDEQIYAFSPQQFIECFNKARFVVTNTFHGTIFSIIFEKPVLFNSEGKSKVSDLLARLGLQYRDYVHIDNLQNAFSFDCIHYDIVSQKVEEFREYSREFIANEVF